jgi:hypothetical protein
MISYILPTMPRSDVARRIQRYYHPLTSRAVFTPERVLMPPSRATRYVVFRPDTEAPRYPDISLTNFPTDIFEDNAPEIFRVPSDPLVRKPSGEVTRISRDGYNLRKELRWRPEFYTEVQVHSVVR